MRKDSGGPAFPGNGVPGMTLRDYFAAKAMQGLVENWRFVSGPDGKTVAERWCAEQCYKIADAMIQARDEL